MVVVVVGWNFNMSTDRQTETIEYVWEETNMQDDDDDSQHYTYTYDILVALSCRSPGSAVGSLPTLRVSHKQKARFFPLARFDYDDDDDDGREGRKNKSTILSITLQTYFTYAR